MAIIESAGISDVGRKRKNNEDAFHIDDAQQLYVVADGMGGHRAGEVAAMLVVETIRDYMVTAREDRLLDRSAPNDDSLSAEANRLMSGIRLANQGVHEIANRRQRYRGMGSTVSAALFTDDTLIVANVGDSPVFVVHNGDIEQLSVTHNVISEQAAINPEATRQIGEEYRHMLTRAVGIEASVDPDITEIPYFKGDKLVIGSDGLSDKVLPREILAIVERHPIRDACQRLVEMANARGGDDNITVIALHVKSMKPNGAGHSGKWSRWMAGARQFLSRGEV